MKTRMETILGAITGSEVYRNYERAYAAATGLPIAFRSAEAVQPVQRDENDLLATKITGTRNAAVPVRIGEQVVGFLETGQVFTKPPTAAHFERTVKAARQHGVKLDREELKRAYLQTRYLPPKQFDSMLQMLHIFAQHLALIGNGLIVQRQNAESPVVTRAKEFIQQNYSKDLNLSKVARAVNTTSFYLCKLFNKTTSINFTDYLSRVRVEKARNLLLNPNLRVSEIAYQVGFQSLTHFNRVFRRVLGQSPTAYRKKLPVWSPARTTRKGSYESTG